MGGEIRVEMFYVAYPECQRRNAMTRHITDREDAIDDNPRLRAFLEIDRASGRHPAVIALDAARPGAGETGTALAQFLRIERGLTA
jgi:hypothetical protein